MVPNESYLVDAEEIASNVLAILANSNRVDALIENSSGDRFKAKALETAPVATGFATPANVSAVETKVDALETKAQADARQVILVAKHDATQAAIAGLPSAPSAAVIADAVWDESLTGASHNIPTSAGRRLRQVSSPIIHEATAQGGTANSITLDTGASSINGAYDPSMVSIVAGTGAGQTRIILQYAGSTRVATVHRGWKTIPDATSEFLIQAHADIVSVNEGLAQAGGANTITLNSDASSTDDVYIGQLCFLVSGTGEDQCCMVCDYNGTTKVATVEVGHGGGWAVVPDATTAYVMMPASPILLAQCDLTATKIDLLETKAEADARQLELIGEHDVTQTKIDLLNNLSAGQVRTELATELERIDVAISTRNATTPPTASANATAVRAELATELGRLDVATSTRATPADVTAVENKVDAVKERTDNLPDVPASKTDTIIASQL
jgi:hypothetical protein